jgi:hypothetical protein
MLQEILEALGRMDADPSQQAFQVLAAGPLEDLLADHGAAIIVRVEEEARRNPRFNLLLGGVWRNSMTHDIWQRVEAARLTVW